MTSQPPLEARALIAQLSAAGLGCTAIANRFNAHGVPTPSGRGRWSAVTVQRHADPQRWAAYMRTYRARIRDGAHVPRQQARAW